MRRLSKPTERTINAAMDRAAWVLAGVSLGACVAMFSPGSAAMFAGCVFLATLVVAWWWCIR